MPTAPASRRRVVSEAIFERLVSDVLSGRLRPGDPVPSERALSEALDVNRHAVREALKRLQQAGLVRVSHGGATRVLDWRRTGGLDLLAALVALAGGEERRRLLVDVAEMRAAIGVDVARSAARHGATGLQAAVVDPAAPYEARAEQYAQLWERIVDAAANVAYRLAFNSLVAAQREGSIDARIYAAEVDDTAAQERLAAAIAAGDEQAAAALARELLGRTVSGLAEGG